MLDKIHFGGVLAVPKSMTGFGRCVAESEDYRLTLELKSVNNRYLEVIVHAPKALYGWESLIKSRVAQFAERGKVDVFIQLETIGERLPLIKTNHSLAAAYVEAISGLASHVGLTGGITMENLLSLPGLLTLEKPQEDEAGLESVLQQALAPALEAFAAMRLKEGERLAADLLLRRESVCSLVDQINELAENVAVDYQERLRQRITELLVGDVPLDEARLANEVAYFADRACIDEELVRLSSHLVQLEELLSADGPAGRKLDFLLQEINREVNTIGSKANCLAISKLVIQAKSELEKIREQIQNIE